MQGVEEQIVAVASPRFEPTLVSNVAFTATSKVSHRPHNPMESYGSNFG